MRLTIFAVPHDNFRRQDIKDVSQNHVLYKPEIHGPYKMLTEFLSWFYSQRSGRSFQHALQAVFLSGIGNVHPSELTVLEAVGA